MPSIQLISQKTRLKTEFKEKFKQKFNIFTAGSLKDGLRNFSKMDIDLLLVDSLPVHLKSTSWLKSFIRQRKTSSGEIAIILIVDPEFVDKSWIQNNTKLISNCQVFWYNQNLFPDLELFLNALESSINFSIENINLVRFAALAN
jgi:hypothetical protein